MSSPSDRQVAEDARETERSSKPSSEEQATETAAMEVKLPNELVESKDKALTVQQPSDSAHVRIVRAATPRQHVIVWLVGVLLASLMPFLFLFLHGLDRSGPPSIFQLLGHGDLLLISLVVTISGITDLVLVMHNLQPTQIVSTALIVLSSILMIVAEALWYADISSQLLDGEKVSSTHMVAYGSLALFCLSAFCSAACVKIAAGAR